MLLDRHRLAVEEPAPARVLRVPDVHGRHVHRLVVEQGEEPLPGTEGLVGLGDGRHVQQDGVVGRRARRRVAIVREVLQQDGGAVPGLPAEQLLLKGERVLEGPGYIGGEIGLRRVEIEQLHVGGGEGRKVDLRHVRLFHRAGFFDHHGGRGRRDGLDLGLMGRGSPGARLGERHARERPKGRGGEKPPNATLHTPPNPRRADARPRQPSPSYCASEPRTASCAAWRRRRRWSPGRRTPASGRPGRSSPGRWPTAR